ncbi:MAG: ATP-binding protein [Oscillospiraceae bacterium]|nr:ATP-binding protein [Oscillospiraceae bacterium]
MAYDGKILARVRDIIAERKKNNEFEQSRRRDAVYALIPAVKDIEAEITRLMSGVVAEALKKGANAGVAVEALKGKCEALLKQRAELLVSAGYPANYIDEIYDCPRCGDTGYVLGKPCTCLKALYQAQATIELSQMLNIDGQCFDNFDLSFYDKTSDYNGEKSPYQTMSNILNLCRDYAMEFKASSANLLFRGGTGLGKTFLSASIAKLVSEKGFSVVYDTAVSVMETFELQKFDRGGDNAEEVSSRVRRYMDCDLLILDDLGTEMTTSFTQSALYTLINGRLINGGKTIVSTNLSEEEMRKRYTPQIVSRLEGEYLTLNFAGKDIRAIKRERGLK